MEISRLYKIFRESAGVSTDSRKIAGGELFFALKGENFDGNAYAMDTLSKGASYAVVDASSEAASSGDPRIIPVEDTLATLKELAAWHREHVQEPRVRVVGLTGTNGKTTTKELIRTVLSARYRVVATEGNLNNDIGVPLSVLKITPDTDIAVIEMGASHPEDISVLVPVSRPDYGLITNVGKAHLLGFGSFEGVKHAKGRLYDYIAGTGGRIFLNTDDPVLCGMASERGLVGIPYGLKEFDARILPTSPEEPFLRMVVSGIQVNTRLVGAYNAANVLAAMAVGREFGISFAEAAQAIGGYVPSNNRSQMSRTDHNLVIEDAYNANPSSMAAALDNFSLMQGARKVALLGDMRELGEDSLAEHVKVAGRVSGMGLWMCCLVGEEFGKALRELGNPLNIKHFATSDELAAFLSENPLDGAQVLVKGSRGIRMEKVLPCL